MQILVGSNFLEVASSVWSSLSKEEESKLSFSKIFSFVAVSRSPATTTWTRNSSTVILAISESAKLLRTDWKKSTRDWPTDCFITRVAERRLKMGWLRLKYSSKTVKTEGEGPNSARESSASGSIESNNLGPKQLLR